MTKIQKDLLKKISNIEQILENLENDFDSFEVYLIKDDEQVYSFNLIEKSAVIAKKGLKKQLETRIDELVKDLVSQKDIL